MKYKYKKVFVVIIYHKNDKGKIWGDPLVFSSFLYAKKFLLYHKKQVHHAINYLGVDGVWERIIRDKRISPPRTKW